MRRNMPAGFALCAFAVWAHAGCGGPRSQQSSTPVHPAQAPEAKRKDTEIMMQTHTRGEGRPLVLVGGGVTGWASWIPHQERLAASRRVARAQPLVVQFGLENRRLPVDRLVELESAGLATAVDALFPTEPFDLVAWSYGALIALDYALEHPERVRTLTLIEPPAFWVLEATNNMEAAFVGEREELRALGETMRDDVTEAGLAAFLRFASLCPPGVEPEELPQWPLWLEHRRSLRGQIDGVLGHRDDADRLRGFDRPVLLVKGVGSTPVLRRIIDVLGETMPNERAIELQGGHAPQIVEMDAFLDQLTDFQADAFDPSQSR